MRKPERSDEKYWTGTRNFNHIQYESDLEDYVVYLEFRGKRIHKSRAIRELQNKAEKMYGLGGWVGEERFDAYIQGVKDLFDYLRDKEKEDKR